MYNLIMKSIATYITEKLIIKKSNYNYFPETKKELKDIIEKLVDEQSIEDIINLNSIDTSKITDMSDLFENYEGLLKIDMSNWNVSNVKRMDYMFRGCVNLEKIIGIEDLDVSSVENMEGMFDGCKLFNQPLNNWKVSKVENMASMFIECKSFNHPLNNWNVSNVEDMSWMFSECESFNQDISKWNVSNVKYMDNMFSNCPVKVKYIPKFK